MRKATVMAAAFCMLPFSTIAFGCNSGARCIGASSRNDLIVGVVTLLGVALALWALVRSCREGAEGIAYAKDDPAFLAAKQEALDKLPHFMSRLRDPRPDDEEFCVKFNLSPDRAEGEWIWAGELRPDGAGLSGRLYNQPFDDRYNAGQRVKIDPQYIGDWSYMAHGVAQGHFMTRVMLESATPRERKRQLKDLGWS